MKKIVCISLLFLVCMLGWSQSNIRPANYWDNNFYINPASIDDKASLMFTATARKQWIQFPGSPTTFFGTGTIYNDDLHTQFGIRLQRDQLGYTSSIDVDLTYAYSVRYSQNWRLNLGIAGSYQNLSYDISKITFTTPDDPSIYERMAKDNNYNADLGIEFTNKIWKFGASSQNLLSLFSPVNKLYTNTNFLYMMHRQYNHDYLNLGYGACAIQYGSTYQMELNLMAYFKETEARNAFQVGLTYRTWSEMGLIFGFNVNSKLKLSYSYDYNVGGISRSSYGTHELILGYRLERKWRCHNCWF